MRTAWRSNSLTHGDHEVIRGSYKHGYFVNDAVDFEPRVKSHDIYICKWRQGSSTNLAKGLRYALDVQVGAVASERIAKHAE